MHTLTHALTRCGHAHHGFLNNSRSPTFHRQSQSNIFLLLISFCFYCFLLCCINQKWRVLTGTITLVFCRHFDRLNIILIPKMWECPDNFFGKHVSQCEQCPPESISRRDEFGEYAGGVQRPKGPKRRRRAHGEACKDGRRLCWNCRRSWARRRRRGS